MCVPVVFIISRFLLLLVSMERILRDFRTRNWSFHVSFVTNLKYLKRNSKKLLLLVQMLFVWRRKLTSTFLCNSVLIPFWLLKIRGLHFHVSTFVFPNYSPGRTSGVTWEVTFSCWFVLSSLSMFRFAQSASYWFRFMCRYFKVIRQLFWRNG